jgi:hypothetical protein
MGAFHHSLVAFALLVAGPALAQKAEVHGPSFDPRKLDHMPTPSQLPTVNFSADEVRSRCLSLFNGKKYKATSATQPLGKPRDYSWPLFNPIEGEFQTTGNVSMPVSAKSPVCFVRYSWKYNSAYVHGSGKDIGGWFNGSIFYTVFPAAIEKSGYLMVAEGNTLRMTRYFYWEMEKGVPKAGAAVHITWGLYTPE